MPNLSLSIPHQYDRGEAKKRTQEIVAQYRKDLGSTIGHLDERWNGDTMEFTFVAMGMPIKGQAQVEDYAVRFEVELPGLLASLANPIKQSIESQARKVLSPPRS